MFTTKTDHILYVYIFLKILFLFHTNPESRNMHLKQESALAKLHYEHEHEHGQTGCANQLLSTLWAQTEAAFQMPPEGTQTAPMWCT